MTRKTREQKVPAGEPARKGHDGPVTKSREIILDILMEVLERGGFIHSSMKQALSKYQYLKKQDRAFITRIGEGTVERLLTIDAVLDLCSKVKTRDMKPVIRTILRMSVYQILWMDRVPDQAVCNEAVKLAKSRRFGGLGGFVNGVLRSVARRKEEFVFEDWSLRYSVPQWILDMWQEQYGRDVTEKMLQASLEENVLTVRCSLSLASVEEITESLKSQGVKAAISPLSSQVLLLEQYDYLEGLNAYQKGWIQVQDAASALVAEAVSPCRGAQVLDVCGAPGGKSLHMADKLKGTGMVVCRDLTEEKIALARENMERARVANMRAEVWDALEFDSRWENKADIVIADLPCSGLGVIRKKPDIKYRMTREQMKDLVLLQRQILSVASRYVKPGGILAYSTCTVSRQENQEQRRWFLENFPFSPKKIELSVGTGMEEETMKEGYLQLFPGIHPCDGFFIAVFKKDK